MIVIATSRQSRGKKGGRERYPGNFSASCPFSLRETPFLYIERALQKGYSCSFAEKSKNPDPKNPLIVRLLWKASSVFSMQFQNNFL